MEIETYPVTEETGTFASGKGQGRRLGRGCGGHGMSGRGYCRRKDLRVYNQKRSQWTLKQYVDVSDSFSNGSEKKIRKAYKS